PLQLLGARAQSHDLALAQGDGTGCVRMRRAQVGERIGMLLEELGDLREGQGDVIGGELLRFGAHAAISLNSVGRTRACGSIQPWNTVVAGPLMRRPVSFHAMVRHPPRVCTLTGLSSRPMRMPVMAAAHAPVPQARVSPAPRSY